MEISLDSLFKKEVVGSRTMKNMGEGCWYNTANRNNNDVAVR